MSGTPNPSPAVSLINLVRKLRKQGFSLHETRIGYVLVGQGVRLFRNDLEGVQQVAQQLCKRRKEKPAGVRA